MVNSDVCRPSLHLMMIVMVPAQHPDRNPRQSRRCNANKSTIEEMRVANVTAVHS
jgi:hypothetical protein